MSRDKHIWEGWTVGDFIDEIEPTFNMKLSVMQHPWLSESALKKWKAIKKVGCIRATLL
jgi:hypothetical protein